jgi:hypothetical protein
MAGPFEAVDPVDVLHVLPFVPDAPVVEMVMPENINAAPTR